MKEYINNTILIFCLIPIFLSCSNDDDFDQKQNLQTNDVEVRNGTFQFKNQAVYDSIVGQIAIMEYPERKDFYNKLGFTPVNRILVDADNELEVISNLKTKVEFDEQYSKFKKRYGKMFVFNDTDSTDLSPYSAFMDPKHELVVNSNGYFYIDGNKIQAQKYENLSLMRENRTYVSLRSNSTQNNSTNHAWSHQSKRKVGLYISIDGDAIWTQFTSQKKNFWGWNRYSTVYEAAFTLDGGFHYYYNTPTGVKKEDKNNTRFQIVTGERDGSYSMILGHLHQKNSIPARYSYTTKGSMEVWSRGVGYDVRGKASVDLYN